MLTDNQKLFLADHGEGELTDMAQYATATNSHYIKHDQTCSAEEADTRIWLHAYQSSGKRVPRYRCTVHRSNGGQPNSGCLYTNRLGQPKTYISITKLVDALKRDPDLAGIPEEERPKILVSLYALSGCDYTSLLGMVKSA